MDIDKIEKRIEKANRTLERKYEGRVKANLINGAIVVSGDLDKWADVVAACKICTIKGSHLHVVNDIECRRMKKDKEVPESHWESSGLKEKLKSPIETDILIIGGGITGCSLARELSRWDIGVVLCEAEGDLATGATGKEPGIVDSCMDFEPGTKKQKYAKRGNEIFESVCRDLDVQFERKGQYTGFFFDWQKSFVSALAWHKKIKTGVDVSVIDKGVLREEEPELNRIIKFAAYSPDAGAVSPYKLSLAYAESALENGVKILMGTRVSGMELEDRKIVKVRTNRVDIIPKLVINAAGLGAEEIAAMAGDRFYSLRPKRIFNMIFDKRVGHLLSGIINSKDIRQGRRYENGGRVAKNIQGNIVISTEPEDAPVTGEENISFQEVRDTMEKQKMVIAGLSEHDLIGFEVGFDVSSFEDDYVVEPGRNCHNMFHIAGIGYPGLTAAPAIAEDVAGKAISMLTESGSAISPRKEAGQTERYNKRIQHIGAGGGRVICSCEGITEEDLIGVLDTPLCPSEMKYILRRCRIGEGRCRGSLCRQKAIHILQAEMKKREKGLLSDKSSVRDSIEEGLIQGEIFDVVVIGAGESGRAAAGEVSRNGLTVLLIGQNAVEPILQSPRRSESHSKSEKTLQEAYESVVAPESFAYKVDPAYPIKKIDFINDRGTKRVGAKALILATGAKELSREQAKIDGWIKAPVISSTEFEDFLLYSGREQSSEKIAGKDLVFFGEAGDKTLKLAEEVASLGARIKAFCDPGERPPDVNFDEEKIHVNFSKVVTGIRRSERSMELEICRTDEYGYPVYADKETIKADLLVLAKGVTPDSEMARRINAALDPNTRGPIVDESLMTGMEGVFASGSLVTASENENASRETGTRAALSAIRYAKLLTDKTGIKTGDIIDVNEQEEKVEEKTEERTLDKLAKAFDEFTGSIDKDNDSVFNTRRSAPIFVGPGVEYFLPQRINKAAGKKKFKGYFRPREGIKRAFLIIVSDEREELRKEFLNLDPRKLYSVDLDTELLFEKRPGEFTVSLVEES